MNGLKIQVRSRLNINWPCAPWLCASGGRNRVAWWVNIEARASRHSRWWLARKRLHGPCGRSAESHNNHRREAHHRRQTFTRDHHLPPLSLSLRPLPYSTQPLCRTEFDTLLASYVVCQLALSSRTLKASPIATTPTTTSLPSTPLARRIHDYPAWALYFSVRIRARWAAHRLLKLCTRTTL